MVFWYYACARFKFCLEPVEKNKKKSLILFFFLEYNNGNSALGVWCAAPELRQAARNRGKHYQPGSASWLLRKV